MEIKNFIKKKLIAKLMVMSLAVGGFCINQSLPAHATEVTPDNPSSGNKVIFSDSDYTVNGKNTKYDDSVSRVEGGHTDSGDANNNTLTIESGTVRNTSGEEYTFVNGGFTQNGNTNENTLIINNGTFYTWVEGGWSNSNGDALKNTITIKNGDFHAIVDGGYTVNGNASHNIVNIEGGTFHEGSLSGFGSYGIYGGYVSRSGDAIGNVINISGGKINGVIYSGYTKNGTTADNKINISGNPDLSNANIYAGRSDSGSTYGNSININTKNITAKNIGGFESLNYEFPSDLSNGDTILTLTNGSTDLSNTTININSAGGTDLHTGDTFTLLRNNNGITVSNVTNSGVISEGVSLDYGLSIPEIEGTTTSSSSSRSFIERNDEESSSINNLTKITAVVGELKGDGIKYPTEELVKPPVKSNIVLIDSGHDRIINWLPPEDDYKDIDIMEEDPKNDFKIFANTSFSSLKTKTGNGSFIRSRNGGMDIGFAKAVESSSGNKLYFAPLFDYGSGNYDSYLKDGIHGHGTSSYCAGGFIFRKMNKGSGFYYEASARYGRARSNFSSGDFLAGDTPVRVSYSVSAPIYAGHIHLGKIYPINRENTFQVYGHYFHTHQGGMDTTLSSGESYNFDSVDSGRLRVGVRLIRQTSNKKNRFYSGLAYQYEFTDDAVGHYKGYSTSKNDTKGSSGMIELGWQLKPSKKSPWMLDLNAVGWVGHQKGITCQAKIKKAF